MVKFYRIGCSPFKAIVRQVDSPHDVEARRPEEDRLKNLLILANEFEHCWV